MTPRPANFDELRAYRTTTDGYAAKCHECRTDIPRSGAPVTRFYAPTSHTNESPVYAMCKPCDDKQRQEGAA